MEIEFGDKKLLKLYTTGTDRRLPSDIPQKFLKIVTILETAIDIYGLWDINSLNFEHLQGKDKQWHQFYH